MLLWETMMIPVADAHCDFLYRMYQNGFEIQTLSPNQRIHIPFLQRGGVKLQFFAIWSDCQLKTPFLQQCIEMADAYERMLARNSDVLCKLTKDFSVDDHKIATVLTVEGGEVLEGSLGVLRTLKRLGVSALGLTWNNSNELAGAAMKRGAKGLTSLGKEVVLEMERIHIALDVSHLGDAGIDDALSIVNAPIFASHSNARSICNVPRCLQDTHIREIARRGGVIGVNFYHKQLSDRNEAQIRDIVAHILHIVKVGGVDACAIGSDFEGMVQYPIDLKNSAYMQDLLAALEHAGLRQEEIRKIAYSNLHDYILEFV